MFYRYGVFDQGAEVKGFFYFGRDTAGSNRRRDEKPKQHGRRKQNREPPDRYGSGRFMWVGIAWPEKSLQRCHLTMLTFAAFVAVTGSKEMRRPADRALPPNVVLKLVHAESVSSIHGSQDRLAKCIFLKNHNKSRLLWQGPAGLPVDCRAFGIIGGRMRHGRLPGIDFHAPSASVHPGGQQGERDS